MFIASIAHPNPFPSTLYLYLYLYQNGKKVVVGTGTGTIDIWNWGDWGDFDDRFVGHPSSVDTMVSIDADTIITGSSDGIIR